MQVHVAFATWCQPYSGCSRTMIVRDAQATSADFLLAMYTAGFGGRTGPLRPPLEWPVTLELVDLGCYPVTSDPSRDPTKWALRMTGLDNPASSALLHIGESAELALDGSSSQRWLARNVASSDAGCCDASTSLSFYLAKQR